LMVNDDCTELALSEFEHDVGRRRSAFNAFNVLGNGAAPITRNQMFMLVESNYIEGIVPVPVPTSAPSSEPSTAHIVKECGESFTNVEVTLADNLFCQDDAGDEAQECAVILDGPEAHLDCQDYLVHQASPASESALNCTTIDPTEVKQECGLNYLAGICLQNGAKVSHCKVEQFPQGIRVIKGGEVMHSSITSNRVGIFANASDMSISST